MSNDENNQVRLINILMKFRRKYRHALLSAIMRTCNCTVPQTYLSLTSLYGERTTFRRGENKAPTKKDVLVYDNVADMLGTMCRCHCLRGVTRAPNNNRCSFWLIPSKCHN